MKCDLQEQKYIEAKDSVKQGGGFGAQECGFK